MSDEYRTVTLDADNVSGEHICCAIGNDAVNAARADQKREWLRHQFPHGHTFKKIDVRGKVFIEYVPAERAWAPVEATGYTFIQCLWVSGRFKGHGFGRRLLEECEEDVADTNGLIAITSPRKKPFMVDKKFYVAHGFEVCDEAEPYFELLVKKFRPDAPAPRFRDKVRTPEIPGAEGLDFYYADSCPFNGDFVAELAEVAKERGLTVRVHKVETAEQAQELPAAWGIYSLFYNGRFVAHDITPPKKFPALLDELSAGG